MVEMGLQAAIANDPRHGANKGDSKWPTWKSRGLKGLMVNWYKF